MPKPPGGRLLRRSRMWRKRGKWLSGLLAAKRDEKWEESVRLAFYTGRRTMTPEQRAELAGVDKEIASAHAQLRSLWQWRARLLEEIRQDGLPVQLRATYRIIEKPFRPNGPSYRTIARINS